MSMQVYDGRIADARQTSSRLRDPDQIGNQSDRAQLARRERERNCEKRKRKRNRRKRPKERNNTPDCYLTCKKMIRVKSAPVREVGGIRHC